MNNRLVVFYSRSGATRRLAKRLARALGADLDEIRERRDRSGWRGFLRSLYESLSGHEPAIVATRRNPRRYAQVIVGTPVWADRAASPVRRYLREHEVDLNHVAFFCTCSSSGAHALVEMADIVDCEPVATLMMTKHDIAAKDGDKPARFVASVLGN